LPTSSLDWKWAWSTFDSSMAGIGGCPFAPGATGNIVTEDLVFMLESMGLHTGVDLVKLLEARKILAAAVPPKSCTATCLRPVCLSAIGLARPERDDGLAVLARAPDGAALLATAADRNRLARRV
jgi:hypothetical protein